MTGVIYKIVNKVNGKYYLGSSLFFRERKKKHKTELRGGNHHNYLLQRDWNKFGEDSFEFLIIEKIEEKSGKREILKEKTHRREEYYLDKWKPYRRKVGYNLSTEAKGGHGKLKKIEFFDFHKHRKVTKTRVEIRRYLRDNYGKSDHETLWVYDLILKRRRIYGTILCLYENKDDLFHYVHIRLICAYSKKENKYFIGNKNTFWKTQNLRDSPVSQLISQKSEKRRPYITKSHRGWRLVNNQHLSIVKFLQSNGFDKLTDVYEKGLIVADKNSLWIKMKELEMIGNQ